MIDMFVKDFNSKTFNKDGNDSAILKRKDYTPPNLPIENLPIKEKFEIIEVNRLRNGYIIDRLTLVDNCEIAKKVAR